MVHEPVYPANAKKLGVEGHVSMEFDLSADGKPINITLLESSPTGVFDQAGIAALSTWVYLGEMLPCDAVSLSFNLPPER
nr:energy transducer TonB [Shewanella psychrophila]